MCDTNFQVANFSISSPSIVSEPPDIKNWFSSYTYQSPELDTNELFGNSLGVDEEEKVLHVEDSENEEEEEENWRDLKRIRKSHQSVICDPTSQPIIHKSVEETRNHAHSPPLEVPTYPDSLSFPSEPPDIRNWFSSYVYESPSLDSSDFDIALLSDNDFGNIRQSENAKEEGLNECKVRDELCLGKETNSDRRSNGMSPRSISVEIDTTYSAGQEKEYLENGADCLKSPAKTPPRMENTETGEVKDERESITSGYGSGWILPNRKSRELFKSIKKADDQCLWQKKRPNLSKNDENGSKQTNKINHVSSSYDVNNGDARREALKETTNIHHCSTLEVSGKWTCLQKSKRNYRPPLKQLRLERWFFPR